MKIQNNLVIVQKQKVKEFVKTFEVIILDLIMDETILTTDFDLYFSICNKYSIKPSPLIEELKKNNKRNEE